MRSPASGAPRALLACLPIVALLAGCAESPAAAVGCEEGSSGCATVDHRPDAPPAAQGEAQPAQEVELYRFTGLVVGASAPHPDDAGPAVKEIPAAKQETFEVPDGVRRLRVAASISHGGSGVGNIEVRGPGGEPVFSGGDVACVGTPAPYGQALCTIWEDQSHSPPGPGTYVIRYNVAGALEADITIVGIVEAAPAAAA